MLFYLNIELLISKGSHQDNSRAFEFESYLNILLRQLHFAPHMYPMHEYNQLHEIHSQSVCFHYVTRFSSTGFAPDVGYFKVTPTLFILFSIKC